jgi:hypothetical protein
VSTYVSAAGGAAASSASSAVLVAAVGGVVVAVLEAAAAAVRVRVVVRVAVPPFAIVETDVMCLRRLELLQGEEDTAVADLVHDALALVVDTAPGVSTRTLLRMMAPLQAANMGAGEMIYRSNARNEKEPNYPKRSQKSPSCVQHKAPFSVVIARTRIVKPSTLKKWCVHSSSNRHRRTQAARVPPPLQRLCSRRALLTITNFFVPSRFLGFYDSVFFSRDVNPHSSSSSTGDGRRPPHRRADGGHPGGAVQVECS